MAQLTKDEIERGVLAIVQEEVSNWEDAEVYITEKIAYHIRNLIRALRKNYYGIFDEPFDNSTGYEKFWFPLTETIVEDVTKTVGLDQKDVNVRGTRDDIGYTAAKITRRKLRLILEQMNFGEVLDADTRRMLIDNIAVWKTWVEGGQIYRKTVDPLNLYFDPQSESLQKAYRVTERATALPEQIAQMGAWENTQNIKGSESLHPTERNLSGAANLTTGQYQDVYELWGKIPKKYITGNDEHKDEVESHVVVSGLESGDRRVHLVEANTKTDSYGCYVKPYEECVPSRIHGVLFGRGPAWRVLHMQEYINMIYNIRAVRGRVSQLGLFKIRRNSGISPSQVSNLAINGAISVKNMDDFQQMPMSEVGPSSYKDEESILASARAVTSTYPTSVGAPTPASMPATNAVLSDRNAKSAATLIQDNLGSFLERWIDRHVIPYIGECVKNGELFEIFSNDDDYRELVDTAVSALAQQKIQELFDTKGAVPTEEQVLRAMEKAKEEALKKEKIFLKQIGKLVTDGLVTDVYVTNEEIDPNVQIQNLLQVMSMNPQMSQVITKEIMNLMDMDVSVLDQAQPQMVPGNEGQMPAPGQGAPDLTQMMENANTLQ